MEASLSTESDVCDNQPMGASSTRRWPRGVFVVLGLALAITATACTAPTNPYRTLTDLELSYVIPNSSQWAGGDPCVAADCGGEIDRRQLREASWFVIDGITAVNGDPGAEATIDIQLDVIGPVREPEQRNLIDGSAWGQDVGWALEAMAAGHELWIETDCPGSDDGYVCHFVAIDDNDRFAGIGYGTGLLLTTPLARQAAHRGSLTGRQFLEDHI
jgi:hypothetical protein